MAPRRWNPGRGDTSSGDSGRRSGARRLGARRLCERRAPFGDQFASTIRAGELGRAEPPTWPGRPDADRRGLRFSDFQGAVAALGDDATVGRIVAASKSIEDACV
jgi:hypothetical protein